MRLEEETAEQFSAYVDQLAIGQSAPTRRFIREFLSQSTRRRSVMLSEIARGLDEPCKLLYSEKRLSRRLSSNRFDDRAFHRNFIDVMAPAVPSMKFR